MIINKFYSTANKKILELQHFLIPEFHLVSYSQCHKLLRSVNRQLQNPALPIVYFSP